MSKSLHLKKNKPTKKNNSKESSKRTPLKNVFLKIRKIKHSKQGIRLNQFIAHAGICSRREADQFIAAGLVTINDEVVT